ncbi:hypothetical protein V6N12_066353 [Hibiscus sabdariffa]|uniref:Uncharacterized protein n=1 Tax=Hibiscus sabdariffa TaxID=183260 RepID=A0ABR2CPV0_9ROSI
MKMVDELRRVCVIAVEDRGGIRSTVRLMQRPHPPLRCCKVNVDGARNLVTCQLRVVLCEGFEWSLNVGSCETPGYVLSNG